MFAACTSEPRDATPGARGETLARPSARSRDLAAARPFARAADPGTDSAGTDCPPVIADSATQQRLTLRGWSVVEERASASAAQRWDKGYYVPADPVAVGLAAGEEYVVRCDRLLGIAVNVPDVRAR